MNALARLRRDEGTSLIELVVGIALMAVFGAMFTGAIVMMTSSSKTASAIVTTSTQLNTAFVRLDKTVRYAAAFSVPGRSTGASGNPVSWYAEFRTTNTGAEVCTQLRVDQATAQLQSRTWRVVAGTATAQTAWTPLATGIANGDVVSGTPDRPVPFVLAPTTGSSARYPSLTVSLLARSGDVATTSLSVVRYPAVNATTTTTTAGVCQELGRP